MSPVLAGVLQLLALIAALALAYRPARRLHGPGLLLRQALRVEKWIYKAIGANPDTEMRWPAYLRGVLAFSAVSVLFLYLLQRLQGMLPGSLGFASIDPDQAFNTAASFVAEHQLAVVLRRAGHGPRRADRRPGGAELRLRRRRHRRRGRPRTRLRALPHR